LKLDFPKFNGGKDLTSWICRVEQFYHFHETPVANQVALASFHLEGEAQLWYQLLKQESEVITWDVFKSGLLARYGLTQFYDYFGELTKLQQSGSVKDYQGQFEQLLAKAGHLPPIRQVSCFVSGLKESIKADVMTGRPTDLSTAIGLARLYEAKNLSQRRLPSATTSNHEATSSNKEEGIPRPPMAIRRLSPSELQQRKDKGLCYNYNEKFHLGHRCKKLFFIEACYNEEDGDVIMEAESSEVQDEQEALRISFHAISGAQSFDTKRVRGIFGSVSTIILLDLGSTHNFLSEHFANRLGLRPTNTKQFKVMVASGDKLPSRGKCIGGAVEDGFIYNQG
jgi:hypothetical protein